MPKTKTASTQRGFLAPQQELQPKPFELTCLQA